MRINPVTPIYTPNVNFKNNYSTSSFQGVKPDIDLLTASVSDIEQVSYSLERRYIAKGAGKEATAGILYNSAAQSLLYDAAPVTRHFIIVKDIETGDEYRVFASKPLTKYKSNVGAVAIVYNNSTTGDFSSLYFDKYGALNRYMSEEGRELLQDTKNILNEMKEYDIDFPYSVVERCYLNK